MVLSKQARMFLDSFISPTAYFMKKSRKKGLTDKESVIFSCFNNWKSATDFKGMDEEYVRKILRAARKREVLESKTEGRKIFYRVKLQGVKFPIVLPNGVKLEEEEFRQTGQMVMNRLFEKAFN